MGKILACDTGQVQQAEAPSQPRAHKGKRKYYSVLRSQAVSSSSLGVLSAFSI
jgi:hypothetical protein